MTRLVQCWGDMEPDGLMARGCSSDDRSNTNVDVWTHLALDVSDEYPGGYRFYRVPVPPCMAMPIVGTTWY